MPPPLRGRPRTAVSRRRRTAHLDQGGVQVHIVRHDDGPHDAHRLLQLRGAAAAALGDEQPPQQLLLVRPHRHVLRADGGAGLSSALSTATAPPLGWAVLHPTLQIPSLGWGGSPPHTANAPFGMGGFSTPHYRFPLWDGGFSTPQCRFPLWDGGVLHPALQRPLWDGGFSTLHCMMPFGMGCSPPHTV